MPFFLRLCAVVWVVLSVAMLVLSPALLKEFGEANLATDWKMGYWMMGVFLLGPPLVLSLLASAIDKGKSK